MGRESGVGFHRGRAQCLPGEEEGYVDAVGPEPRGALPSRERLEAI